MQPPVGADQARWIIERGENARSLLGQQAFLAVVDDLSNLYLASLVATPPGPRGQDAREEAHLLHHALAEIVATLRQYDLAAVEMQRLLEDRARDAADGDDEPVPYTEDDL